MPRYTLGDTHIFSLVITEMKLSSFPSTKTMKDSISCEQALITSFAGLLSKAKRSSPRDHDGSAVSQSSSGSLQRGEHLSNKHGKAKGRSVAAATIQSTPLKLQPAKPQCRGARSIELASNRTKCIPDRRETVRPGSGTIASTSSYSCGRVANTGNSTETEKEGRVVKEEAVKFLKGKLLRRKVHLNRHHAAFSENRLVLDRTASAQTKSKPDFKPDKKKLAAIQFLKQAGAVSNPTDSAAQTSLTNSPGHSSKVGVVAKSSYKIDRRQSKCVATEEGRNQKCLIRESSRLGLRTSNSLGKAGDSDKPLDPKVSCSRFKLVRCSSAPVGKSKTFAKPGNYKLVNTGTKAVGKDSSGSEVKPHSRASRSRYKLVKPSKQESVSESMLLPKNSSEDISAPKHSPSRYKVVQRQASLPGGSSVPLPGNIVSKEAALASKYKWTKTQGRTDTERNKKSPAVGGDSRRNDDLSTRYKFVRKRKLPSSEKLSAATLNTGTVSTRSPRQKRPSGKRQSRFKIVNDQSKIVDKDGTIIQKSRFSLRKKPSGNVQRLALLNTLEIWGAGSALLLLTLCANRTDRKFRAKHRTRSAPIVFPSFVSL